jgi:hypothetical protein
MEQESNTNLDGDMSLILINYASLLIVWLAIELTIASFNLKNINLKSMTR